jgi:hypothetical protein
MHANLASNWRRNSSASDASRSSSIGAVTEQQPSTLAGRVRHGLRYSNRCTPRRCLLVRVTDGSASIASTNREAACPTCTLQAPSNYTAHTAVAGQHLWPHANHVHMDCSHQLHSNDGHSRGPITPKCAGCTLPAQQHNPMTEEPPSTCAYSAIT